jgi:intracellular sulfur oxidation DsrE/DsrF family protein
VKQRWYKFDVAGKSYLLYSKIFIMNKSTFFLAGFLFVSFFALAQKDYKVVFDLTSKDSIDQRAVIRWLNEVSKAEPTAQMEVVMYGQGLNLVVKGKSFFSDDVVRLAQNKNISFRVCQVAMKNQNIDSSQLLDGVGTVPDGIYEVISKQRQDWGYIKVKN